MDRFRKRKDELRGERRPRDPEELAAAADELSSALGAAPAGDAYIAALERLTELRAAGRFSEEDFVREKRRLAALHAADPR